MFPNVKKLAERQKAKLAHLAKYFKIEVSGLADMLPSVDDLEDKFEEVAPKNLTNVLEVVANKGDECIDSLLNKGQKIEEKVVKQVEKVDKKLGDLLDFNKKNNILPTALQKQLTSLWEKIKTFLKSALKLVTKAKGKATGHLFETSKKQQVAEKFKQGKKALKKRALKLMDKIKGKQ